MRQMRIRLEFMEKCLEQLKDIHRDAIECIFFKGIKFRQYEQISGLSESGAKRRVERAVAEFKRLFRL